MMQMCSPNGRVQLKGRSSDLVEAYVPLVKPKRNFDKEMELTLGQKKIVKNLVFFWGDFCLFGNKLWLLLLLLLFFFFTVLVKISFFLRILWIKIESWSVQHLGFCYFLKSCWPF